MHSNTVTIIGGGAVGCALAYTLAKTKKYRVVLIEKNDTIPGTNQSSRNAGVIHSGLYYPRATEPLKSRLCVEGNALLYEFCEQFRVPYKNVGKLVVATTPMQEAYLDYFLTIARENGVPGITKITGAEVAKREPNVHAIAALLVPSSGVLDPDQLVACYAALARVHGAVFLTATEMTALSQRGAAWEITGKQQGEMKTLTTDILINAAGLWSDDVARMIDPDVPYQIDPVRGELAMYPQTTATAIGMNIYQAPYGYWNDTGEKADVPVREFVSLLAQGKITRTVGVHLTPTFAPTGNTWQISDTVAVGPLKTVGKGKDNYQGDKRSSEDYIAKVHHFFPSLKVDMLTGRYNGIMAVLPHHYDFVIEKHSRYANVVNLVGIDSPGLTSSLAIAAYVKNLLDN